MELRLVPEVLDHGATGLIVDGMDEAVQAVQSVARYDRGRIRARFEQRFSASAMARRYVELYWRVLEQGGTRIRLTA
jgi:glycosyltransferase involved in cell wall biosynthesis